MSGHRRPGTLAKTLAGLALTVGLLWAVGLDLMHALILAAAAVAVVGLRNPPAVNTDQGWPADDDTRTDTGVRREVARLSWSMQGYESRVQRQSVGRLHRIATYRLAERGLDLDDPRDYLACQSVLGERAYSVVSEPEVRPLYADFEAAVTAVERLQANSSKITGGR